MVRSEAVSAPTIICVLWPAGAKRGGRTFVMLFLASLVASLASSSFSRSRPMVRRIVR